MPMDLTDIVGAVLTQDQARVIDAVGPDVVSFRELLVCLSEATRQKYRFVEVPRAIVDKVMIGFFTRFYPGLVNDQQYRLLFDDNTADAGRCQELIGRPLLSPRMFFKQEFSHAGH